MGQGEFSKSEAWQKFDSIVNWRSETGNRYEFSLKAPEGHLPHWRQLISGWGVSDRGISFLKRALDCPIGSFEASEAADVEVGMLPMPNSEIHMAWNFHEWSLPESEDATTVGSPAIGGTAATDQLRLMDDKASAILMPRMDRTAVVDWQLTERQKSYARDKISMELALKLYDVTGINLDSGERSEFCVRS